MLQGAYGEKGEKGEPGLIITRNEGESRSFGELDIREICSNVLKGKLIHLCDFIIFVFTFFFNFLRTTGWLETIVNGTYRTTGYQNWFFLNNLIEF